MYDTKLSYLQIKNHVCPNYVHARELLFKVRGDTHMTSTLRGVGEGKGGGEG